MDPVHFSHMNTSARWINDYLEPPASAQEQA